MDKEKNPTTSEGAGTVDSHFLVQLVSMKMPFGKYKGTLMQNLPIAYLEWFAREGFPQGKLGMLLATVYEIKINGLSSILHLVKVANQK